MMLLIFAQLSNGNNTETKTEDCTEEPCRMSAWLMQKLHRVYMNITAIHGNWGSWQPLEGCSVTCGTGTEKMIRNCDSPEPDHDGEVCEPSAEDGVEVNWSTSIRFIGY